MRATTYGPNVSGLKHYSEHPVEYKYIVNLKDFIDSLLKTINVADYCSQTMDKLLDDQVTGIERSEYRAEMQSIVYLDCG
ncbi:hypothetical protein J6590_079838 [Homalodisca vitripennis]|nr:hypothetical protein J6590_079838 [Homalodisca vitripennis]